MSRITDDISGVAGDVLLNVLLIVGLNISGVITTANTTLIISTFNLIEMMLIIIVDRNEPCRSFLRVFSQDIPKTTIRQTHR